MEISKRLKNFINDNEKLINNNEFAKLYWYLGKNQYPSSDCKAFESISDEINKDKHPFNLEYCKKEIIHYVRLKISDLQLTETSSIYETYPNDGIYELELQFPKGTINWEKFSSIVNDIGKDLSYRYILWSWGDEFSTGVPALIFRINPCYFDLRG